MIEHFFDLFVVIDAKSGNVIKSYAIKPFEASITNLEDLEKLWKNILHLDSVPIFYEWESYLIIRENKKDHICYFAVDKNSFCVRFFENQEQKALLDDLTGCYKKGYCKEFLSKLLTAFIRYKDEKFSIVMFDLDHFKKINDTYGHLCGDYVLATIAKIVRKNLRSSDIFCRFGGEEFIVILPKTLAPGALRLAHRLRQNIASYAYVYNNLQIKVTASFGITTVSPTDSVESLIERCDQALYQAKKKGRNRVEYL